MKFGDKFKNRIKELKEKGAQVSQAIIQAGNLAAEAMVKTATDLTPPLDGDEARGTNTITGESKAHWETDSITEAIIKGKKASWVLGNNLDHISYLNDGHRMDQHFVPGLMVNPYNGMLERVPPEMGGIMVGTQTEYVPGLHITDAAVETFWEVYKREYGRLTKGYR